MFDFCCWTLLHALPICDEPTPRGVCFVLAFFDSSSLPLGLIARLSPSPAPAQPPYSPTLRAPRGPSRTTSPALCSPNAQRPAALSPCLPLPRLSWFGGLPVALAASTSPPAARSLLPRRSSLSAGTSTGSGRRSPGTGAAVGPVEPSLLTRLILERQMAGVALGRRNEGSGAERGLWVSSAGTQLLSVKSREMVLGSANKPSLNISLSCARPRRHHCARAKLACNSRAKGDGAAIDGHPRRLIRNGAMGGRDGEDLHACSFHASPTLRLTTQDARGAWAWFLFLVCLFACAAASQSPTGRVAALGSGGGGPADVSFASSLSLSDRSLFTTTTAGGSAASSSATGHASSADPGTTASSYTAARVPPTGDRNQGAGDASFMSAYSGQPLEPVADGDIHAAGTTGAGVNEGGTTGGRPDKSLKCTPRGGDTVHEDSHLSVWRSILMQSLETWSGGDRWQNGVAIHGKEVPQED